MQSSLDFVQRSLQLDIRLTSQDIHVARSIAFFATRGIGLITLFDNRFLKWRPSQRTR